MNRYILFGLSALLLGGWVVFELFLFPRTNTDMLPPVVGVAERSFNLEVTQRGVVAPARIIPISSQISSNLAKIVWLVDEGSVVTKGMPVARFDSKPFTDNLMKAEQDHGDAVAALQASEKMLYIQEEEEQGKIEEAERKLEIAIIQADNTLKGAGPLHQKVLEQKLQQAKRELEISASELQDLEVLLQKGHVSIRERDKAADRVLTAEEEYAVATAELANFTTYAWPKMERESKLLVGGARSNLTRVRRTAELHIGNRKAEVEKNRRLVKNRSAAVAKAQQDVANCNIISPADGILLYAEIPRDNGHRKVQIGDSVWVGQTFLEVPDTSALVAEVQVREMDVAHLKPAMAALIEVDAFPDKTFPGQVESIATLAVEDSNTKTVRRFPTRIRFIGDTGEVHVGMSVTVTVQYQQLKNVISVPIGCVYFKQHKTLVKKVVNGEPRETEIRVGARGRFHYEVLDGLEVGDMVLREG